MEWVVLFGVVTYMCQKPLFGNKAEPMRQPELTSTKNGGRCLICYYTGDAYNQAIEAAERHFSLVGDSTINVVAIPARWKYPQQCSEKPERQ